MPYEVGMDIPRSRFNPHKRKGFEDYFLSRVYASLKNQSIYVRLVDFHQTLVTVIKERRCESGGYTSVIKELVRSITTDEDVLNNVMDTYRTHVSPKYLETQTLYPESTPVIKDLEKEYGLGLIANQPREARRNLRKLGILDYFEVLALSDEVGYSKPDLRIFAHALEESGCAVGRALMIGDRLDNDVAPAKSIGMKAIRVRRGLAAFQEPQNELERPDYTVSALWVLPALLANFR